MARVLHGERMENSCALCHYFPRHQDLSPRIPPQPLKNQTLPITKTGLSYYEGYLFYRAYIIGNRTGSMLSTNLRQDKTRKE